MSPRARGVRLPLPRPVAPPLPLPTRRRTPPPLITPRHLVLADSLLRRMLKYARWFKSHQGALKLSKMRRDRRQWALEVFDEARAFSA